MGCLYWERLTEHRWTKAAEKSARVPVIAIAIGSTCTCKSQVLLRNLTLGIVSQVCS
ncbi:MAG: hypothetical protein EBE86_022000 [Hormoscilla sp. GUM202]|nr:hypothetical protein [Hormoscilla sp. GUM202]